MIIFVYGGSGSGKSAFAEEISSHYGGSERYYVATMKVFDGLIKGIKWIFQRLLANSV